MNNLATFYIVRHGNTLWNKQNLIQGHSDSPLTEEGISQAKELAKELKKIKFDLIFSSDLLRAKRTAEIIALENKLAIQTNKLLRERYYGQFEGKPRKEFDKWDEIMDKLTIEEQYRFKSADDVESDEEMMTRFLSLLRETAIANPRKRILIVTHGGVMRALLIKLGYGTYFSLRHGAVKNGAYIVIDSDGTDFFIREASGIEKKNE